MAARDTHPHTYVALLRGINVGGKNKIPMPELAGLFSSLGHQEVRTYLQSGNVVFRSTSQDLLALAGRIEEEISERFGVAVRVLARTDEELAAVAAHNPFAAAAEHPARFHVVFLADPATPASIAALDPGRSPPDEFVIDGREIYVHYPNGAGRSKLTIDYFERILGTSATARN